MEWENNRKPRAGVANVLYSKTFEIFSLIVFFYRPVSKFFSSKFLFHCKAISSDNVRHVYYLFECSNFMSRCSPVTISTALLIVIFILYLLHNHVISPSPNHHRSPCQPNFCRWCPGSIRNCVSFWRQVLLRTFPWVAVHCFGNLSRTAQCTCCTNVSAHPPHVHVLHTFARLCAGRDRSFRTILHILYFFE